MHTRTYIHLHRYVPKVLAGEAQFPGDAGLYGMLEAAMEPGAAKEISYAKFAEMWLLGNQGANDAIKAYFMAVIDPYSALPATTPKSKHV